MIDVAQWQLDICRIFGIPAGFIRDILLDMPSPTRCPSGMDIGEEEEEEIELVPFVEPAVPAVPAMPEPAQEPEPVKEPATT